VFTDESNNDFVFVLTVIYFNFINFLKGKLFVVICICSVKTASSEGQCSHS